MKQTAEIFEILKAQFGDKIIGITAGVPKEDIIEIAPAAVEDIFFFLRDNEELKMDNLILLTGLDDANGKKEVVDGLNYLVGGTLSVMYHIESTSLRHKLVLKTVVQKETPEVATLSYVYGCANWQEREAYDMIGIIFTNHPNLMRILMPYDWDAGYPLRKDYKNPEFYQGMKVPY